MAFLMAEHGLESHACDFFAPSYFPPELTSKVQYFKADILDRLDVGSTYDLVFLRGLTNEHRVAEFDVADWGVFFDNLRRLAGPEGFVYWVMMGRATRIRRFDQAIKPFFPQRRYRFSSYHAAILSQRSLPEPKRIPLICPEGQVADVAEWVFRDLQQNDGQRLMRGVFSILNEAYSAADYDFSLPVVLHEIPLAQRYFQTALHRRVRLVSLERLEPSTQALILCGNGDRLSQTNAVIRRVGHAELLNAWNNCEEFFVSADQDGNLFEKLLRAVAQAP
jgi:hypothetical protein